MITIKNLKKSIGNVTSFIICSKELTDEAKIFLKGALIFGEVRTDNFECDAKGIILPRACYYTNRRNMNDHS